MVIVGQNFVGWNPADVPVADEYIRCNFAQPQPDTSGPQPVGVRILPSISVPVIFRNCNLMNCEPPPSSTLDNCNTWIVEQHVPAFTEELIIDGVVEDVRQYYDRVVHARYINGAYDRTGFPRTDPEDYRP